MAVLVAEAGFEDAGFCAGAKDLHGDEDEEDEEKPEAAEEEDEAEDSDVAEEIDGIANAGVEAVSDELAGLRSDGEGAAELQAGDGDEEQAEEKEEEAGEAEGGPGVGPVEIEDPSDGDGREDEEEEELAGHGEIIAERQWRVASGEWERKEPTYAKSVNVGHPRWSSRTSKRNDRSQRAQVERQRGRGVVHPMRRAEITRRVPYLVPTRNSGIDARRSSTLK